jgi:hypothetical protein
VLSCSDEVEEEYWERDDEPEASTASLLDPLLLSAATLHEQTVSSAE